MPNRSLRWPAGICLVSTSSIMWQLGLTRVFTLGQWYHYAFLALSLTFLGYGGSGTAIAIWQERLRARNPALLCSVAATCLCLAILGGYLGVNLIPFDAFRLVLDRVQLLYLVLQYLVLLVGFFLAGFVTAWCFTCFPDRGSQYYFASLLGSGLGAFGTPLALRGFSEPGLAIFSALLAALAGVIFSLAPASKRATNAKPQALLLALGLAGAGLLVCSSLLLTVPSFFSVRLSEYKALSQVMQFPDARVLQSLHDEQARIDVVDSTQIHYAPGLSHLATSVPPRQLGLFMDGDSMTAITPVPPEDAAFARQLLTALPYAVTAPHRVLIINPRGGLDVLTAAVWRAPDITVVEDHRLVTRVVPQAYGTSVIRTVNVQPRSFLASTTDHFDLIVFSLTDSFNAISTGAYSMHESYLYTVEGMKAALDRLAPGGILAIARWLQIPPSESVRLWATLLTAMEENGQAPPHASLMALRTWRQVMVLAKRGAFTSADMAAMQRFSRSNAFDLVYFPGMVEADANQYNVLAEPIYYRLFRRLLETTDRSLFYKEYQFDVRPPRDRWPFFFHFFRSAQLPQVVQNLGKQWQPFGGGGFLVVFLYLALAAILAASLILLPLRSLRGSRTTGRVAAPLAYFSLLGLAFLFVEVPLMHQFILFLDHPTQAFSLLLGSLLMCTGAGSLLSARVALPRGGLVPLLLGTLLLTYPVLLPAYIRAFMGQPLWERALLAVPLVVPLAAMGVPFPLGLRRLAAEGSTLIPWAWAANGCASVLASILGMLIALQSGYYAVLRLAAVCYMAAGVAYSFGAWGEKRQDLAGAVQNLFGR